MEQILWEMINGRWYAFGTDGYLKSGWVYDYELNSWYFTSAESGMQVGWYSDTQDNHTYYLEPETGKLVTGWKEIDNAWYYFHTTSASQTRKSEEPAKNLLNKTKPFGSMYKNEKTPDGYYVNTDGAWDGKAK